MNQKSNGRQQEPIDVSATIVFERSPRRLVLYGSIISIFLIGMSSFAFIAPPGSKPQFMGSIAMIGLLAGATLAIIYIFLWKRFPGNRLVVAPEGILDQRISDTPIPWSDVEVSHRGDSVETSHLTRGELDEMTLSSFKYLSELGTPACPRLKIAD